MNHIYENKDCVVARLFKTCLLLMSMMCLTTSAFGLTQDVRLNMNKTNADLTAVLSEISQKTGCNFFYNDNELLGYKVSFVVINATIDETLETVLGGVPFTYSLVDGVYAITPQNRTKKSGKNDLWNIRGTVIDKENQPVAGVAVVVKGTSIGVGSDSKGRFELSVKPTEDLVLLFKFVGMKTREVAVSHRPVKDFTIVMEEDAASIGDVIVTGFGNKSKNSFTGSAITVKRDELMRMGTKNVLQSLSAFVPGMQIVENNAAGSNPNALPEIVVQGRSSFEGESNLPTFIVDGAEVDRQYIYDMDVNDIESAMVLKDASATALYGSRAANGVIVITTKALEPGRIRISYSGTVRATFPDLSEYDLLNASEKLQYEVLAGLHPLGQAGNIGLQIDQIYNERYQRVREGVNTDWLSLPLQNAFVHNHNINAYGGDEYIRYSLGLRYGSEPGVMKDSGRDRVGLNFKLSYNLAKKLFFQNSFTITSVNSKESKYGSFSNYVELNPYDRAYNLDGSINNNLSYDVANPLYEASLGSYNRSEQLYFNNVFDLRYDITRDLRVDASFSLNKRKNDHSIYTSPDSKQFATLDYSQRGSMNITNNKSLNYEGKIYFSYNKRFVRNSWLSLSAGANIQSQTDDAVVTKAIGIMSDKLDHISFATRYSTDTPGGSYSISRMAGYFLTANYIYNNRYYIDGSFRYEGSSKYGSENRFAPFWSIGGGWNLHNEKFLHLDPATSTLKLRASIGTVGNVNFDPTQSLTTYKYDPNLFYLIGVGATPITIGNPALKWERTTKYNVGLDANLFKNRFSLTFDWYNKITDDLLLDITTAPSLGVNQVKMNMGSISNRGIDIMLRGVPIRTKEWNWNLGITMSHNKNTINKISNSLKALNEKNNSTTNATSALPVYAEGESTTAIKVVRSAGVDPATGKEIYIKRNGEYTFDYDYRDKVVFGDADPTLYGSISSYLTYKGISLNLIMSYRLGATIYNSTLVTRVEGADPKKNADRRVFTSRWKNPGDQTRYVDISQWKTPYQTSRFVQDEYSIKLSSISIAYDFPRNVIQKLRLRQLRVEILSNDLTYLSTIKQERGLSYPFARSIEFSLRTTF